MDIADDFQKFWEKGQSSLFRESDIIVPAWEMRNMQTWIASHKKSLLNILSQKFIATIGEGEAQ